MQGGRSCAGAGGPPPKSLDSDENFKAEHTLFCRKLRFVSIYALFVDHWAKRVPFWVKNSVSGQEVHYYMVAYFLVKFANLPLRAKKTHLSRKLKIRA